MDLSVILLLSHIGGEYIMSRKIGFGIIGLGVIAETHIVAINNNDNCRFIGAFDMVPGKAKAFCEKHGMGTPYEDLESFLSNPELEVVTIATPSGYHLDPALAAIEHGKHVIIEKPMEITPERSQKILDAAKAKGVIATGVFQSRFYEAPQLIKKAIEEGRFGRLTMVDAQVKWFRTQQYYDSGAWRGTWKVDGGGALMNQSIHAIDLLQWFVGKAEEVQAYTATLSHERIEVEDTGVAVVKFQNGALGVIEGSTSVYPGFLKKLEICGTEGSVVLEEESLKCWSFKNEKPEDAEIRDKYFNMTKANGGANDPAAINTLGHQLEFHDLADAIINGTEPAVTGESACEAVKIICAIYESVRTGKPAKV